MSDSIDIAGSEEIITLNNDTQDTFNDLSYRPKQVNQRSEKKEDTSPMKENKKPSNQAEDPIDPIASQATPPPTSSQENQSNPFLIRPPTVKSTLIDESSQEMEQGEEASSNTPTPQLSVNEEKTKDSNVNSLDTSASASNLRLYVSPCTSLLETTHAEEAPSNASNAAPADEKPKDEPMETNDAQVSLGSDGVIVTPNQDPASVSPPADTTTTSTRKKMSPTTKASYALSQPTTDKFEAMLSKLVTSPARQPAQDPPTTMREEEELLIKETVSKIVRRYRVRLDQEGRTVSRDLLDERVVEENTTTRVESWPSTEKKPIQPTKPKPVADTTPALAKRKSTKVATPKRKAKSLKPASTAPSRRKAKLVQSDDDEPKTIELNDTSDESEEEKEKNRKKQDSDTDDDDDDNEITDDVTGEEFLPPSKGITSKPVQSGARIFAKWVDGHFYPGLIGNVNGEKYNIQFDDGGKRTVKSHEIICQSYLPTDQDVLAQTQDGYFEKAVVKRLIKKKKSDTLGYVVEKDGKQRWYPLHLISLTPEQAEDLPFLSSKPEELSSTALQRKRKRTSPPSQSPAKKSKSITTHTPTRSVKLLNSMHFLITGFNDIMETRHRIEDAIESHGGRVIEKMPSANRRDRVYLISDVARKTAKFFEAKKLNVPCVNYKWIEESVDKMEVQDWEKYDLLPTDKETNSSNDDILDAQKED